MTCRKVKKNLDKLLEQEGIVGYGIDEKRIVLYVEKKEIAEAINLAAFKGYEIEVREVGRLKALWPSTGSPDTSK